MSMNFTSAPKPSWSKLLFYKRDKLKTQDSIPLIEATWNNAEHPQLNAYQKLFGFPENHIPLSYPQVLATPLHLQLFAHTEFPFPALGIIHTQQKMKCHHPLSSAPFTIKTWVQGHRVVRVGAEFSVHTQVHQNDILAWEAEMIILTKAVKGHGQKEERIEPKIEKSTQQSTWSFPSDLGRQYAKVSGDYNPIHLYPLTAKLFGMPRHIIHGMYSVGKALSCLPLSTTEVDISFRRPIFLPAKVEFLAEENQFIIQNPKNQKIHLFGSHS